jgi:hypothetical protein
MFLAIRASPQVPSLVARSLSGKLEAETGKALIRKGAETQTVQPVPKGRMMRLWRPPVLPRPTYLERSRVEYNSYEEFRDGEAQVEGDDIMPFETGAEAHRLQRIRRWLDNFVDIRAHRQLTSDESDRYAELCQAEADMLRARGGAAVDREPRPEDFPELPLYIATHTAWQKRQIDRVREQVAKNTEVFGGVPNLPNEVYFDGQIWRRRVDQPKSEDYGEARRFVAEHKAWQEQQPRTAQADGVDRLMRSILKPSAFRCKLCGEPPKCLCDRPRTAHLDANTFAMDVVELDWQAEGLTFAGELKAENARRKEIRWG